MKSDHIGVCICRYHQWYMQTELDAESRLTCSLNGADAGYLLTTLRSNKQTQKVSTFFRT